MADKASPVRFPLALFLALTTVSALAMLQCDCHALPKVLQFVVQMFVMKLLQKALPTADPLLLKRQKEKSVYTFIVLCTIQCVSISPQSVELYTSQ